MSIKQMVRVWDTSPFSGSALLIELAIADFSNDEGQAWPSIATLARKSRLSEKQARRLVHLLAENKRFTIITGAKISNLYQMPNMAAPQANRQYPPRPEAAPNPNNPPPADGSTPLPPMGATPSPRREYTPPADGSTPLPPMGAKPPYNHQGTVMEPPLEQPAVVVVDPTAPNPFRTYEENIGPLTPLISEDIKSALVDYSTTWLHESILEAVRQNRRSWAYCKGILRNWAVNGYKATKPAKAAQASGGLLGALQRTE